MFSYSTVSAATPVVLFPAASKDWRVRISLAPNSQYFYNDPSNTLLSPLINSASNGLAGLVGGGANSLLGATGTSTVGVVFPYTPAVTITHSATYTPQKLTHTNYTQYFYQNSEVMPINIQADFTVQNVNEGQYLLATIYLFRSLTKMFFGQDANATQATAGNPPPIVYLNGYGEYYLPNVPCVVTSFSHTMPADSDYMDIPEPGITFNPQFSNPVTNSTRLPTTSTVTLTLQPVYSRLAQSQYFSLNDFAAGALLNMPGGALPASGFGATVNARYVQGGRPNGGFI
jgi:hypothetical protein